MTLPIEVYLKPCLYKGQSQSSLLKFNQLDGLFPLFNAIKILLWSAFKSTNRKESVWQHVISHVTSPKCLCDLFSYNYCDYHACPTVHL